MRSRFESLPVIRGVLLGGFVWDEGLLFFLVAANRF